jgi:aspartyl protease family protein
MVVLEADRGGHYATELLVNGQRIVALVDTGATTVAFNRTEAERLGLDFRRGRLIRMRTASGEAEAYLITLNEVQMGPILLRGVEATVSVLPNSPQVTLLGMSFLRRLELVTDGRQLKLMQLR